MGEEIVSSMTHTILMSEIFFESIIIFFKSKQNHSLILH